MPEEQLLEMFVTSAMTPQNPNSVAIRTILECRTAEKQLRAANEAAQAAGEGATFARALADSAKDLVTMTRRLGYATWGLVSRDCSAGDRRGRAQGVVPNGEALMAQVVQRTWRSGPRRRKRTAWGCHSRSTGNRSGSITPRHAGRQPEGPCRRSSATPDYKMTLRYSHLSPAHLRADMDRMEGLTPAASAQGSAQNAVQSAQRRVSPYAPVAQVDRAAVS
jgi:hypothetical protein